MSQGSSDLNPENDKTDPDLIYDDRLMQLAFEQSRKAIGESEVPIGCVVVKGGSVVAEARNEVNKTKNPTKHAEIVCVDRIANDKTRQELEVGGMIS
jgi:tRNA(adenine34) deaminase